ncbi:MAG: hypothetical protein V1668_01720 [Patescibacteria group bacterium]
MKAAPSGPIAAPPDQNASGYLLIDGSTQAKSGSLRLGSGNVANPFNYQLEVLGEGAQSTEAVLEQNLKVGTASSAYPGTLFVDAANNKVCVGPCLGISGSKLEVSGGTWSINAPNADALSATSSSAEALYGSSVYPSTDPGVQGTSASDDGYGVRAENQSGIAAQGQSGQDVFDKVLLYNDNTTTYTNVTAAAANSARNDIYYGADQSNGFLSAVGDAMYFGRTNPFNSIALDVTNYNSVGEVWWEYCTAVNAGNCTAWLKVDPVSGPYSFKNTDPIVTKVTIWTSLPTDWVQNSVNGSSNMYYVRAWVTVSMGGTPRSIGSQMIPGYLSSVYGYSQTGYGIYAINANPYGLWAGYFDGQVEGSGDVSGAKLVRTAPQASLVPFTAGQAVDTYNVGKMYFRFFDGTYLWAAYESKIFKIRAADGFKIFELDVSSDVSDMLYDGQYIWMVLSSGDRVKKMNPYDPGQGTGPGECSLDITDPVSIAFDGTYYWVATSGSAGGEVVKLNSACGIVGSAVHLTDAEGTFTKIIYNGSYLWVLAPDESNLYNINPSSGKAMFFTGLVTGDSTDIFYDNYYYWILDASSNTAKRFYLSQNRVCSIKDSEGNNAPCTDDASCSSLGLGGCFAPPVPMSDNGYAGFGTGGTPTDMAFDGTYLWIVNAGDSNITRLNAALPADRSDFALGFEPTGIAFDGTYLYVFGPTGITKIFSGTGYGHTDMSRTLTLQNNTPLTAQSGSFNIAGSGRIGSAMTAGSDLIAASNAWPTAGSGDVIVNPAGLGAGTKRCPAGHYIKNVVMDGSGRVTKIECRGL